MKKSFLLLFISITCFTLFLNCKKEKSPKGPDKFDLYLINTTDQNYNTYISANMDDNGFVNEGVLQAKNSQTVDNLIINIMYSVKLIYAGEDPNQEKNIYSTFTFKNKSPNKTTITKEID